MEGRYDFDDTSALGNGAEDDYVEAVRQCQKAAEKGDSKAQRELGSLYRKLGDLYRLGKGVEQDYVVAVEWYRRAVERDCPEAQYWIGRLYEEGLGLVQDYDRAARSYEQVARQGLGLLEKWLWL